MQLTNNHKRWLEIIFYLICNKIFSINNNVQDILNFIKGYQWTNMFDYDIIVDTITNKKIMLDTLFIPSKFEFYAATTKFSKELRIPVSALKHITEGTSLHYKEYQAFYYKMKDEVEPVTLIPKLTHPKIHEQIYRFLLSLNYISDFIKKVRL